MIDFGVLSVIRNLICDKQIGAEYGLNSDSIFIIGPKTVPNSWPIVLLELEEAWGSSQDLSNRNSQVRLVIKISVLSASENGHEAIEISNQIGETLDGQSVNLLEENAAIFKLNSSVVDIKKIEKTPRKVEQYYEVWICSQKLAKQQDHNLI